MVVQRGLTADLLGQRLNITVLLHMMFRLGRFACKQALETMARYLQVCILVGDEGVRHVVRRQLHSGPVVDWTAVLWCPALHPDTTCQLAVRTSVWSIPSGSHSTFVRHVHCPVSTRKTLAQPAVKLYTYTLYLDSMAYTRITSSEATPAGVEIKTKI